MQKYFFIKTDGKYVKINYAEILYVEGCRNYVKIATDVKTYLVLIAMKRIEQLLPLNIFLRIHRSYIVSLDKVTEFNSCAVLLKDKLFPVGNQYKGALEEAVTILSDDSYLHLSNIPVGYLSSNVIEG